MRCDIALRALRLCCVQKPSGLLPCKIFFSHWHKQLVFEKRGMNKAAQIAPGIRLENRDVADARGVVCAVEYVLVVEKDKLVVFDLDLSGSTNIALDQATASLRKRVVVQPRSRAVVGVARIVDTSKGWYVGCQSVARAHSRTVFVAEHAQGAWKRGIRGARKPRARCKPGPAKRSGSARA